MTVDQIIEAGRKWKARLDSQTIAQQMGIPEHVIYANLWRIRREVPAREAS